jgi:hypothetical protein
MRQLADQIPPLAGTRIPEALDRLVELYTAWDKPEQAAEWRKKRDEATATPIKAE